MNRVVWKYPLVVDDFQQVGVPVGAQALCVQMQGDTPCLWVLVDPEAEKTTRNIYMAGTGHDRPDLDGASYLGSFQMLEGKLIFHVFDGGSV